MPRNQLSGVFASMLVPRNKEPAQIGEDIEQGADQTCQHAGNRALVVHALGENTHHQRWEQRCTSDTKGKGNRLCCKPRRIKPK